MTSSILSGSNSNPPADVPPEPVAGEDMLTTPLAAPPPAMLTMVDPPCEVLRSREVLRRSVSSRPAVIVNLNRSTR
jgi:hypothetical protein